MTRINQSLNGIPGTLWEIRRQEYIHPYLGLRQAVLIIGAQEKAIREGRLSLKKALLEIEKQRELSTQKEGSALEIAELEIEISEHDVENFKGLILDAEVELNVATSEKSRIENHNPEMLSETYDSLQIKYASEAFHRKLARAVTISALGACRGVSEGAAEILHDSNCLSLEEQRVLELNINEQLRRLLPPQLTTASGEINGSSIN